MGRHAARIARTGCAWSAKYVLPGRKDPRGRRPRRRPNRSICRYPPECAAIPRRGWGWRKPAGWGFVRRLAMYRDLWALISLIGARAPDFSGGRMELPFYADFPKYELMRSLSDPRRYEDCRQRKPPPRHEAGNLKIRITQ